MIHKALEIASKSHRNQYRKSGKIPFILHPMETAIITAKLSKKENIVDDDLVAASLLHDVVEDTDVTFEELEKIFNSRIVHYVRLQSEDKSKSWPQRKQETIELLKNNQDKNPEILVLADKLANLREINKDYESVGEKLWERFNVKDKEKHQWYYESIGENIKYMRNTHEFNEYMELLHIFTKD